MITRTVKASQVRVGDRIVYPGMDMRVNRIEEPEATLENWRPNQRVNRLFIGRDTVRGEARIGFLPDADVTIQYPG